MIKNILYFFILCFLTPVLYSCIEDDSIQTREKKTFGIRHDKNLVEYEQIAANPTDNMPSFSSVISFSYSLDGSQELEYVATGTLIHKDWILTAAHNFYDAEEQDEPAPKEGVLVKIGNDPNSPTATYRVDKIIIHPSWLAGNQEYKDANDLCLVKLNSSITTITPAQLCTKQTEVINTIVWHCGFGDYSKTKGQNKDLDSKKHAIQNTLDRLQNGLVTQANNKNYSGGLLAFDFDNPAETINSLGDEYISSDEIYLGQGTSSVEALPYEGTTVEGDSGGPLFIKNEGVWKVAGVLSGGAEAPIKRHCDSSYGDISIYTRVSTSYDWIQSVITHQ